MALRRWTRRSAKGKFPKILDVLDCVGSGHPIQSAGFVLPVWPERPRRATREVAETTRVKRMTLTCPNCGNARNFQVKTLQVHVVRLEDARIDVQEEQRPAVLELLCDECETELKFEEVDEALRKEVLLTLGAR
jgi:RNase P subunit RPR2